jgi:hypothetical protein
MKKFFKDLIVRIAKFDLNMYYSTILFPILALSFISRFKSKQILSLKSFKYCILLTLVLGFNFSGFAQQAPSIQAGVTFQ